MNGASEWNRTSDLGLMSFKRKCDKLLYNNGCVAFKEFITAKKAANYRPDTIQSLEYKIGHFVRQHADTPDLSRRLGHRSIAYGSISIIPRLRNWRTSRS